MVTPATGGAAVADIRAFNRFYTGRIGLLDEHLPASPFTLAQARVLFELAHGNAATASDLSRLLGMDKAQVSRILARFLGNGLLDRETAPDHRKRQLLALTTAGQAAFAALEEGTIEQMKTLLAPLAPTHVARLTAAMATVRSILDGEKKTAPVRGKGPEQPFVLRPPIPGDLGWITHRQALLYAGEYGWDWTYEGLMAGILGAFVARFDPALEAAWIAERNGAIAGSVFLMRGDTPEAAKLRLLYVEPAARGLGLGASLVDACIARARQAGYGKLTLWTNSVLVSARRIYEAAGFRLAHEEAHRSFGHDLVGQTWTLDLGANGVPIGGRRVMASRSKLPSPDGETGSQ